MVSPVGQGGWRPRGRVGTQTCGSSREDEMDSGEGRNDGGSLFPPTLPSATEGSIFWGFPQTPAKGVNPFGIPRRACSAAVPGGRAETTRGQADLSELWRRRDGFRLSPERRWAVGSQLDPVSVCPNLFAATARAHPDAEPGRPYEKGEPRPRFLVGGTSVGMTEGRG